MLRKLLLVSNTSIHDRPKFDHARAEISDLFQDIDTVTFIPYARPGGISYEEYAEMMRPTFEEMGYKLELIDREDPINSVQGAEAIYVGGGNTWELLQKLKDNGLSHYIKEAVTDGIPYLGSSAGSNVAGLTIGNTNDMPAAESHGRGALGLVPFNVNPHYQDPLALTPDQRAFILEAA